MDLKQPTSNTPAHAHTTHAHPSQDHELSLMFFHTTAPFPLHVGNLFGVDKLDFNNFSNDPHNFNNNNYSGFVWPSAVVLSAFISRNPHLFRDKTVLEVRAALHVLFFCLFSVECVNPVR